MTEMEDKELAAYRSDDSDDDNDKPTTTEVQSGKGTNVAGGNYAGTHLTTFKDFLLKEELLRAINEAGFENPS